MKKYIFLLFLPLFLFNSCMDEPVDYPNTNTGNFEALWKIIDTKYCFLDYKNINWDSIHYVYQKTLKDDATEIQLFDLLSDMLAELKDGHVNLFSSFDRSRYWNWYTDYAANYNSELIYTERYLGDNYRIAGGFKYRKIANDSIGYINYSSFMNSFSNANMRYILTEFKNCEGLIIDVRDNGGGSLDYSKTLASYFFKKDTITGYIQHKTGPGHSQFSKSVAIKTEKNELIYWGRPVIILSNRLSYSATNDFVNRMKNADNALIVGDNTGGGGGLPHSSELPNGWLVRFSASPMFTVDMQQTEWGIEPDVKISMDSTDQAKGYDTIIEEAIKIIKKNK